MLPSRFFLLLAQSPIPPSPAPTDTPLINPGARHIVYIGLFVLAIAITAVVGIISRRVEYALIFAAILSAILIALLWFL